MARTKLPWPAIGLAALAGEVIGVFWLYAIDASVNGAQWPPNWHSGYAYLTCPFIPFIGRSDLGNFLVPLSTALFYAAVAWTIHRLRTTSDRAAR
jgi:hypothetical protein